VEWFQFLIGALKEENMLSMYFNNLNTTAIIVLIL